MGTVCETCGDEGFVEAFVYCDACKVGAVHRYCCGIMPVPIDDYVIWFCSECEGSDTGFECKEVDQVGILTKSEKKKKDKKKKKKKRSNHTPPVLKVEYHELQDSSNVESVEVTSAPPIRETVEEPERREVSGSVKSNELTGLVGNEASVLEAGDGASVSEKSGKEKKKKMKKRKRKSIDHSLPDSTNVEPVEASKKQDDLDTGKSDELTGLVRNEISVLEKNEKKKKKRNEGSSDHTSPVLEAEGHGLLDTTNVEATKESKKPKSSDNREYEESNGLVRNEVSVLEKSEKKKKKKAKKEEEKKNEESSNHTSPVLGAEDHGLQDASSAESMKESKKQETTESRNSDELNNLGSNEVSVLEKSEKKKKKKKKMTNKEEEKKNEESSNHNSPVLVAEDHGLQDASSAESRKESKKRKTTDSRNSEELNGLASNEVSVLEKSEKKKKKKKKMTNNEAEKKNEESCNHTSPVLDAEDHGLRDATSAEPMRESKKQKTSDSRNSDELNGLVRNEVSVLKISEKNRKKKKKKTSKEEEKKNEESSNHRSPVLDAENHGLQDATSAEPMNESKTGKTTDSRTSDELKGLASNEVSVVEKSEKKRKKQKKKKEKTNKEEEKKNEESSNHASPVLDAEDHGVQDATSAELMESKKRKTTDNRNSDEWNGLARKEVSVLEKTEKKKKKKTNKEEEKKIEESCTHTSPVLDAEDHGLQDANRAEPMKESKKQKTSDSKISVELNDLATNEVSVLEKSEKKKEKKNKESSNHTSPVLDSEDHGLQDATSAVPMKESKKQKTSDSRNFDELNSLVRNEVSVLEKSAKKKETNKEEEESSNHTLPVLAVEDNGVQDTINVEPAKAQESSASGKPHELVDLAKYAASVSEGGNSSTVPDHNSCTTSRKRRLSSGNIRVTSENTELAAANSSCKEAESNMPQTNGMLTATDSPVLNNDRALPIFKPIWRGSISVKQGSICSIDRLVAHLSSLACHKVHEKASSLHTRLSAEMFPRLEIWPESFLKNGPPTDESIALYFFPSRDSKDEKVYYSLVHEMKNDDLAMRCVLDNVELLIFTSYQLPMDCWTFHSKEYLWGIFRRRKTSRH